jgi:hypothetical protein
LIPTAAQRTVVVQRLLGITLIEEARPDPLIPSSTWSISIIGFPQAGQL